MIDYNHKNTSTARLLRKNMTSQEKHLWYDYLCSYPVRFQKQKPILNYIVDFYCAQAKLVIELDGSPHYEETNAEQDADRTANIETLGIEVIRFSNYDVDHSFDGVCRVIDDTVRNRIASFSPGQLR